MTSIPPEINEVYETLKTEIMWIHSRWIVYRQLFAKSKKRIDILNKCASVCFYIIHDALYREILVSLSRITDPQRSGKRGEESENLSLAQLQKRLDIHGDKAIASQTKSILKKINSKYEPFREWRNKKLAHLDFTTVMKSTQDPLPGISRKMIEEALGMVREFMNNIETHYKNSEIAYEHVIMQDDGDALVAMLICGMRYEELRKEQKVPCRDLHHTEWYDA